MQLVRTTFVEPKPMMRTVLDTRSREQIDIPYEMGAFSLLVSETRLRHKSGCMLSPKSVREVHFYCLWHLYTHRSLFPISPFCTKRPFYLLILSVNGTTVYVVFRKGSAANGAAKWESWPLRLKTMTLVPWPLPVLFCAINTCKHTVCLTAWVTTARSWFTFVLYSSAAVQWVWSPIQPWEWLGLKIHGNDWIEGRQETTVELACICGWL